MVGLQQVEEAGTQEVEGSGCLEESEIGISITKFIGIHNVLCKVRMHTVNVDESVNLFAKHNYSTYISKYHAFANYMLICFLLISSTLMYFFSFLMIYYIDVN